MDQRAAAKATRSKAAARTRSPLVGGERKNLDDLRHFVGASAPCSRSVEARLYLAERLIKEHTLLEAELHLLQLRGQQDDPVMAARAVETLARMMTDRGLLDEAVYYYRLLGTEFARVTVRDGKTGADYFKALSTDKRFWPYLDDTQSPFRGVNLKVLEVDGPSYSLQTLYPLEFRGPATPFMKQYRLAWRTAGNNGMTAYHLKLIVATPTTKSRHGHAPARIFIHGNDRARLALFHDGHLAVVCLGHVIYGLDLAERKKLWDLSARTGISRRRCSHAFPDLQRRAISNPRRHHRPAGPDWP